MSVTSTLLLVMSSTCSMKTNLLICPRIQEFVEKSLQQKPLANFLVINRQIHTNIDGGHSRLLEVDLFLGSDPNQVFDNDYEMSLHNLLVLRYQLATRSPRLERCLEDFHAKATLHVATYVVQMAQLHF
jgi:hypothetical protein